MVSSASDPSAGLTGTDPHGAGMPVIGLTTYLQQASTGVWDVQAAFLPQVYFGAVTRAGGIAPSFAPVRPSPGAPSSRQAFRGASHGRKRISGSRP